MKKLTMALAAMVLATLPAAAQMQLNGAGATFPYVIYSKWFDVYNKKTGVQFNYQSIGSGGGIKQVIEGTVDFGASDGPMTDAQMNEVKQKQGTEIMHIPTVMGGVVATYNLPEAGQHLKLDADALAGIYLGEITTWNDPRITNQNKDLSLPNKPIIAVHRSDGSGTSFIFTDYLSKVSKTWSGKVGKGTSVNWPLGLGGKGNEGVSGMVKQTEGAIGYVEQAYAVKNNLPYASLKNKAGFYVEPSLESVTEAAQSEARQMPADMRVSITNAAGKKAYPICGFTWLLIYKHPKDKVKGKAIQQFLHWAMKDGEAYAADLMYAPLPKEVVKLNEKLINSIAVK